MTKRNKSQSSRRQRTSKKARAMIQANRDVRNKIGGRWPPGPDEQTVKQMIRERAEELLPRL